LRASVPASQGRGGGGWAQGPLCVAIACLTIFPAPPPRLVWVEIGMMGTLLLMGLWQINYLKNFFQAKKLI
jgi:hypothetical protein